MQRVRFFDGQFLSSKDFQVEQEYHREKCRLHNRMLHGVGVVDGLDLSIDDGPGTAVVVSPGFALDGNGNEIVVESPARVDLATYTSDACFVTIEFTVTSTDPVPVKNGSTEFSRDA